MPSKVQQNVPSELDRTFGELLIDLSKQKGIEHAVVGVESLDASFRWIGAIGDAHPGGEPMLPETPYLIASVTKLNIAAATFKLIEQGQIRLQDPVSALLPPSLTDDIHRLKGVDYSDMITVQHLLGHTSGLPDYLEESRAGEPSLFQQVLETDRSWTTEEAIQIVRERLTPHFPPQRLDSGRQRIQYSDTNYQLLIAIIESVKGSPIGQVFREFFFEPLGLERTALPEDVDDLSRVATVWIDSEQMNAPLAMVGFRDLISTTDDQLRFMRGLVDGEIFDKPVTVHQMMGNWNTFGLPFRSGATQPSWPIQYGLGAVRFKIPRILTPIKPVPPIMGHTGISGSWLFYCPDLKAVLAGTVDQVSAAPVPFRFVPRMLRSLGDSAAKFR